jgi:hypothetical protein
MTTIRATIAFLESDRPADLRADERNGDFAVAHRLGGPADARRLDRRQCSRRPLRRVGDECDRP